MLARRLLVIAVVVGCGGNGGGNNGDDDDHPGDAGSDSGVDQQCGDTSLPFTIHAQPVASAGLEQPVYVQQAPGSDDLYVVEKLGKIVIVRNGTVLPTPFLEIPADVINIPDSTSEGGLLSVAFHKDYATNGRFFVYDTLKDGGQQRLAVQEYLRSTTNPDVADPSPVAEHMTIQHNALGNVGGTVAFGPDGYLWLATGDAAQQDSPAKDLVSYLGKVLRVDVDELGIPPPGGINGSRVWDYGLRNPYRFSFDRVTGDLFLADAGEDHFEEVNIEKAATGNANYGWDIMEGKHCLDGTTTCNQTGLTLPQFELAHEQSFSVIIGGTNYRGSAIPNMRCHYIYAVFGTGRIKSFVWNGSAVTDERELSDMFDDVDVLQVTSIVQDTAGELYMTSMANNGTGNLYKIVGN